MTAPVVAMCMPIGLSIDPMTFRSYRFLDRSMLGPKGWHHIDAVGLAVATARNLITAEALGDPAITHLFWVDADMVFAPDALRRLLAHDLPFVGGLCFDRRPPYKPVLGRYMDPSWGYDPHTIGWLYDYPADAVIDVDATGGAFLLIKREVFEAVRQAHGGDKTWTDWWTPLPAHQQAEDLSFCARAKRAGFTVRVDTGCKIGHVAGAGIVVDEPFARKNRVFEAHRWNPPLAMLDARETHEEKAPVASVIIPTYNTKPDFLLAAVRSALAQTVPVEVIVVDDGTSGPLKLRTKAEDEAYWRENREKGIAGLMGVTLPEGVKLIRHPENRGISAALNSGIQAMTTDWFAWLSADDLFEPHKVETQLAALLSAEAKVGCHNYNLQKDNGCTVARISTPRWQTMEEQRDTLSRWCAVNGSTVMIHREVLDAVRLPNGDVFDTSFKYSQDWEMWCRLGQTHFFHVQSEILGTRRDFGNLTEKIAKSRDLTRAKEHDDRRVIGRWASANKPLGKIRERLLGHIPPGASVLDVGAGLGGYHEGLVNHGCKLTLLDAHKPYLDQVRVDASTVLCDARTFLAHRRDQIMGRLITGKNAHLAYDFVIAIDFIEHLTKEDALEVIADMFEIADRGVILFTPEGFLQMDVDYTGMGADALQTHRSGWSAEELEGLGFTVQTWPGFHGRNGAALWAARTF